jgi:predicted lipoprotein
MNKVLAAVVGIVIVVGLFWLFPPFHVRSLQDVREAEAGKQFDAAEFVDEFWSSKLLPATTEAAAASEVLELIAADLPSVRERFGRTVGVSTSYFLFLQGSGRVVSVSDERIGLAVERESDKAQIVIPLGFVFGNAVRDGTGLLDPSDHPNAQEFNDISAALNGRVETEVLPRLKALASTGTWLRFAGCAEVADEELDLNPLSLVPVYVEAE